MSGPKQLVVVTGMSGAGKSQALKILEDIGFFCIDNLPLAILPQFIELTKQATKPFTKVGLGIDIREGEFLKNFFNAFAKLKSAGIPYRVLFFDADDQSLIRRYSETRRRHPLRKNILEGIWSERKKLSEIRAVADRIITTSNLTLAELKEAVLHEIDVSGESPMSIMISSFGYKYGVPVDADIVWDVRFLPNPNYVARLKRATGKDPAVKRFIHASKAAKKYLEYLRALLTFMLPLFVKEGKSYLTIAFGCTGGRHRSVFFAEEVARIVRTLGAHPRVVHRDIDKDRQS